MVEGVLNRLVLDVSCSRSSLRAGQTGSSLVHSDAVGITNVRN
jgi:hypothetical protein